MLNEGNLVRVGGTGDSTLLVINQVKPIYVSFTVPRGELRLTLEAVREAADVLGAQDVTFDENVSKVSVVGLGMARQTGVADKAFRALADAGINIQMITTSEIKISVLIRRDEAQAALRALHRAFELETPPPPDDHQVLAATQRRSAADAAEIAERLKGSLEYWDGVTHQHAFSLPKFIRTSIARQTRIVTDANPLIVS